MGYAGDPLDARGDRERIGRFDDTSRDTRRDDISDEQNTGLRALSDLDDLAIADGEPDIRGWTVRTNDGVAVGEVDDLIVDTGAMKVRYMCVELDKDAFELDTTRRVLVPLGTARLDDEDDNVYITAAPAQLLSLPLYDDDAFRTDDRDSHELFGRPWMTGQTASVEDNLINTLDRSELYAQAQYDDRDFFGARRRERQDQSYLQRQTRNAAPGDIEVPRSVDRDAPRERSGVDDRTEPVRRSDFGDELR